VAATIDGLPRRLCLTLGALAELEDAFALEDLGQLAARFGTGHLSARDLTRILGAGLRGAGAGVSDAELASLPIEGGVAGAARVAAELLDAAFGGAGGETPARP
jgi:hypothetical protein